MSTEHVHRTCGGEVTKEASYGVSRWVCHKCLKLWNADSMDRTVLYWLSDNVMRRRYLALGFPFEADGQERFVHGHDDAESKRGAMKHG